MAYFMAYDAEKLVVGHHVHNAGIDTHAAVGACECVDVIGDIDFEVEGCAVDRFEVFVRRFSRWVYWLDAGAILFSASICATAWLTYCATCSFDSDIACVLFSIAEPRRVMSTLRIPEHDVAAAAIAASAVSERKFFFHIS